MIQILSKPLPCAYKLISLEMTCSDCPSQWEGELDNGMLIYIRYRSGKLRVGVGYIMDGAVGASMDIFGDGELLQLIKVGGPYDGSMSEEQMLSLTGLEV